MEKLREDPLLLQLLDVYARTPEEDRKVIVMVLDREVQLRRAAKAGKRGPLNGIRVTRPNPSARLYVRVHEPDGEPLYGNRGEMMQAMIRTARAMHQTLATTGHTGAWQAAVRDALESVSPEELDAVAWVNREMLDLVEAARQMAEPTACRSAR